MEVAASQGADSALPRPLRLLQEVSPTPPWPLLSWAPQCWAGLDWVAQTHSGEGRAGTVGDT